MKTFVKMIDGVKWTLTALLLVGMSLTGCKKDEAGPASITEIVQTNNDFTILRAAVTRANLADALSKGTLTVFAPNDAAFRAAGIDLAAVNSMPLATLTAVLQYHVLATTIASSAIPTANNTEVTTLGGAKAYVTKNASGVSVNGIKVITPDLAASNGTIHVIDNVLLPPSGNIVQVAQGNTNLTYLVAAVLRAGSTNAQLIPTLSNTTITVFAPTNAAFQAAGFASIAAINAADPATLAAVLLNHVVVDRVFSANLVAGNVPAAGGKPLAITLGSGVQVRGAGNGTNNANVTAANIVATNGVVHVVDRVLLP
jgi:uncharacterized surface protein with fasciclin (FAS1) repeats